MDEWWQVLIMAFFGGIMGGAVVYLLASKADK